MPQFAVYKNRNETTRGRFPLLLDVQSDLLEPLNTRVVVPLSLAAAAKTRAMEALTPKLGVAGKEYVMVTPQLAGISTTIGDAADAVTRDKSINNWRTSVPQQVPTLSLEVARQLMDHDQKVADAAVEAFKRSH